MSPVEKHPTNSVKSRATKRHIQKDQGFLLYSTRAESQVRKHPHLAAVTRRRTAAANASGRLTAALHDMTWAGGCLSGGAIRARSHRFTISGAAGGRRAVPAVLGTSGRRRRPAAADTQTERPGAAVRRTAACRLPHGSWVAHVSSHCTQHAWTSLKLV